MHKNIAGDMNASYSRASHWDKPLIDFIDSFTWFQSVKRRSSITGGKADLKMYDQVLTGLLSSWHNQFDQISTRIDIDLAILRLTAIL